MPYAARLYQTIVMKILFFLFAAIALVIALPIAPLLSVVLAAVATVVMVRTKPGGMMKFLVIALIVMGVIALLNN